MAASQVLVLLLSFLLTPYPVFGQVGRAKCSPAAGTTNTNQIFSFQFKFDRQMQASITSIGFFDSSSSLTAASAVITSPDQCTDNTTDSNGHFEVGFDVNGDDATLPCGISKSGNTYTITIATIGTSNSAIQFTCTTGSGGNLNNNPTHLNITDFETGNLVSKMTLRSNTQSLNFQILQADGNKVPALTAELGLPLQLRVFLNKEASFLNRHSDNVGTSFTAVFLEHADADIYLEISTPGLGTIVRVSGAFTGSAFSTLYPVKRDVLTLVKIPDDYRQVTVGNAWVKNQRTVRVEVLIVGTVVGVKAISRKRTGAPQPVGEYTVLPDNSLGTKYNCYTGSQDQNGGQVLVYGVEASTTLTINFNAFTIAGVTIDGAAVTATTTATLNKGDVLYMSCGNNCKVITLTSDKSVGVVTGHENQKILATDTLTDFIVSQPIPVSTYGSQFVISEQFIYQIILEDPTTSVMYSQAGGPTVTANSGTFITAMSEFEEINFTGQKVMLLAVSNETLSSRPFSFPYPAVHQWSTRQFVYTEPGVYVRYVVTRFRELNKMRLIDKNILQNTVNTPTIVPGPGNFEADTIPFTIRESTLLEFRSSTNNKNFMVFLKQPTSRISVPYGIGLPPVNPCTPSSPGNTLFGSNIESVPRDGIDNDCDGEVDEEINNGEDDDLDPDTAIDEDLAADDPSPYLGVYVKTLTVSDNAVFSTANNGIVIELITDGCTSSAATPRIKIEPFVWNKNVGHAFDTYHVIDTPIFYAYYLNTPRVYYRIEAGFCRGNLTGSLCENSCQAMSGRRRRQADDEIVTLETDIEITGIEDDNSIKSAENHSCTMNKLYWIPAVLVLLTILIESVVIISFLLHRSALTKDL